MLFRSILQVLGDGVTSESEFDQTLPYGFDSGTQSYVRSSTIYSGVAYWVRNYDPGHATFRLVRTAGSDSASFGNLLSTGGAAPLALGAAITRRSGPPAPPGGSAASASKGAQSASGGSGCGAGGALGLIVAAMAFLGLRRSRRS